MSLFTISLWSQVIKMRGIMATCLSIDIDIDKGVVRRFFSFFSHDECTHIMYFLCNISMNESSLMLIFADLKTKANRKKETPLLNDIHKKTTLLHAPGFHFVIELETKPSSSIQLSMCLKFFFFSIPPQAPSFQFF